MMREARCATCGEGFSAEAVADPPVCPRCRPATPSLYSLPSMIKGEVGSLSPSGTGLEEAVRPEAPQEALKAPLTDHYGNFIRVQKLGEGGMGEVWKAWDAVLGRWVALKFLKSADVLELARFRREAQIAGKLSHPNIAAIYQVGEARGTPFIAMQFVAGKTLLQYPFGNARKLAGIVRDAARAMGAAHGEGVVHRDLKPSNLMVVDTPRGPHVYVMDFGIARAAEADLPAGEGGGETGRGLTMSGALLGTPAYMSPEQARGEAADARSDVFSMGATLYHLLTGELPFPGQNAAEMRLKVKEGKLRPPREIEAGLDPDLEAVILKCMRREPSERYANGRELAEDLERYVEGAAVGAREGGFGYRLRKWVGLHKAATTAIVAVLVAVATSIIVIPGWAKKSRELEAQKEQERQRAEAQRELERRRAEGQERARPHLEAGRTLLDEIRLLMREPEYSLEGLQKLADRAIGELEKARKESPESPEPRLEIGRALVLARREEEALKVFGALIADFPRFARGYLERVRLRIWRYEWLRHSRTGTGRRDETPETLALRLEIESDLDNARRASSDYADLRYIGGVLAFARGDDERAQALLGDYLAVVPRDAAAWYWRGHALHHLGRHQQTIEALTQAVRYETRRAIAYEIRAEARAALNDLSGALADLDQAIANEPGNARWHIRRAMHRLDVGDRAGAEQDLGEVMKQQMEDPVLLFKRACLRNRLGGVERKGSIEDLTQALKLAGQAYPEAYCERGFAKSMLGDADGALADYNEAIRLKPDFFLCYFNRGCVLGRFRGDHEGALQDLRKALELAPPDWSLRKEAERLVAMALGYVATPKAVSLQQEGRKLLTQQSYDRAVETFRKIIEEFPGTPEAAPAAYNIACAYALSGRKPLALDWLEKSVEMGFHDADHIAKDSDLDPLREDPRYGKLIERLKK